MMPDAEKATTEDNELTLEVICQQLVGAMVGWVVLFEKERAVLCQKIYSRQQYVRLTAEYKRRYKGRLDEGNSKEIRERRLAVIRRLPMYTSIPRLPTPLSGKRAELHGQTLLELRAGEEARQEQLKIGVIFATPGGKQVLLATRNRNGGSR